MKTNEELYRIEQDELIDYRELFSEAAAAQYCSNARLNKQLNELRRESNNIYEWE